MTNTEMVKKIIQDKYLHHGNFTLSSGQKSDKYFDIKGLIAAQDDCTYLIRDTMGKIFEVDINFNSVGGIEFGGALLTAQIVQNWINVKEVCFIRKRERQHGLKKMIEGSPCSPVLLIDDVVSTSNTIANAVQTCIDNKLEVAGVLCVIDRRKVDASDKDYLILLGMNNIPNGICKIPIYSLFTEHDFE